jgi:hypothetical protein
MCTKKSLVTEKKFGIEISHFPAIAGQAVRNVSYLWFEGGGVAATPPLKLRTILKDCHSESTSRSRDTNV